jgi:hypothetical protein
MKFQTREVGRGHFTSALLPSQIETEPALIKTNSCDTSQAAGGVEKAERSYMK